MEKAKRYNKGKLRHELIPVNPIKLVAEVYTRGAHKYSVYKDNDGNLVKGVDIPYEEAHKYELIEDGANNWRKGMSWMSVIACVERHIADFKNGKDIDSDLGTYNLANATWNLLTLLEYYKIYPQGDDRPHKYLKTAKIGLDIDEVLADWVGHWTKHHGQELPEAWEFDRHINKKFDSLKDDKDFWMSIPVKTSPKDIPFEPHCYITSRSIPREWTEEWLDKNGFPQVKVYSVGHGATKIDVAKESGIDIFVDDRFHNFVELNNAGICTFLFDALHNQRYDVGYKRIKSLKELV
jgi:5'(3')-deoxyribonucleotidase